MKRTESAGGMVINRRGEILVVVKDATIQQSASVILRPA